MTRARAIAHGIDVRTYRCYATLSRGCSSKSDLRMELREFVRSTLLEIVAGVTDAQKALTEEGSTAVINATATSDLKHHRERGMRALEMVEFDVALTVTETTDKGIGGRLSIAAASVGAQRGASVENSEVSRVRFKVPIALPLSRGAQDDGAPGFA